MVCELREAEIKRIKDSAINQALETIRNRIDQFGVAEPIIQRQGLKQIVVQFPGIKEPKRAKDLIKETACWSSSSLMRTASWDGSSSRVQKAKKRKPETV